MRTTTRVVTSVLTVAALVPSITFAQRTATRPGAGQPWQCQPTDSARAFNRGLRVDSLAAQRAAGGVAGGAQVTGGTGRSHEYPEYDVVLDIPNLCVQRIFLKVDSVTAKLNLNAQVANLLRVNAGADVLIGNVDLTIQGVRAQALLLVDLDDVVQAVDQTLTFIDNHPEVVNQLTSTVSNLGGAVGGLVNSLLLGTVRNAAGQLVQRVVDQTTGSLLERTVDAAGQTLSQRTIGSITSLPQVSQLTNSAGQLVRRVRDQTGRIIEYVQDAAGKLSNIRIVQQ